MDRVHLPRRHVQHETYLTLRLVGRAPLPGDPKGSLEEEGGVLGQHPDLGLGSKTPPFRSKGLGRYAPCDPKIESPPHRWQGKHEPERVHR